MAAAAATAAVRRRTRHQGTDGLISWTGNPPAPNGSAPRATRVRYATAPGAASAVRRMIRRGMPAGKMGAGNRNSSLAGLSWPSPWSHAGHPSMCRSTRLRSDAVSAPPRAAAMAARSGHGPCPARLARKTRDVPNLERARETSARTRDGRTPSTAPRSAPSRPWRRFSSMISPSAGLSPASAARTTARSSICPSPRGSAAASAIPAASWRTEATPTGSRPRHSLRATANSHARRRPGSCSPATLDDAMTKVS